MIEVRLTYDGGGKFSPASHVDFRTIEDEIEPGEQLVARMTRPRSNRENNLFHAVIQAAWMHQRGGPLFPQEDGGWMKLRAWLLCEAGHCDLDEFDPGAISPKVVSVLKARGVDAFWTVDRRTKRIRLRTPKSVSFKLCKSPEFQPVKNAVFEMIETVIVPGAKIEQLVRHGVVDDAA